MEQVIIEVGGEWRAGSLLDQVVFWFCLIFFLFSYMKSSQEYCGQVYRCIGGERRSRIDLSLHYAAGFPDSDDVQTVIR